MQIVAALKRLWRHAAFRRLLTLRILSQAADGTLQVGMASYILFSPQSQPTAWAIAGVLAITFLPFTLIGPFVSPWLDSWSRRNVAFYCDITRAALAIALGVLIAAGTTSGAWAWLLFAVLLVALSINRFMLAGLSAGLQHTVDEDEFLTASSIVPTVGPLGVVIGAVLGFATRATFGGILSPNQADAVVFALSAAMFIGSVLVCRGFARDALGPRPDEAHQGIVAQGVVAGLVEAWRHVIARPLAGLALSLMAVARLLFGLLSVGVILLARNTWHPVEQSAAALADLTLWGLATGVGFLLAAPCVPIMVRKVGLRRTALGLLGAAAAVSVAMAFILTKPAVYLGSFLIGLCIQSFKICVDTIIQAHVEEHFKGRVFTFYDMFFNGAFVLAGVVAAFVLPAQGISTVDLLGIGAAYVVAAVLLASVSKKIGYDQFEKGTEDLTRR